MTEPVMRLADGPDAGAPWHYGDPLGEQRTMATGVGVVDRGHRDVLAVPGADRLSWLHAICSQHVADLADGDSTEALVLSPRGHVEAHWQLTELRGTVWLDTEPGAGAFSLDYLTTMRFLNRVEPADLSPAWAVLSLVGPRTPDVLSAAGLPSPGPGHARALDESAGTHAGFVRGMGWPGTAAADLLVPRPGAAAMLARLHEAGARPAGVWAYEALRVEARRPRLGFETDHRTIPHELDWIGSAVHLHKGCYRGQETVARVQNLGKPPRRMVLLYLSGESELLPETGTSVVLGERTVGFVGTAVQHHELGPIALAVLKRAIPDDAALSVEACPVAIG